MSIESTHYALVAVSVLQAVDNSLGTVGAIVVYDYYLEVKLAAGKPSMSLLDVETSFFTQCSYSPCFEGTDQKPSHQRDVLTFVVCGQEHRVLVRCALAGHISI